MTLFRCIFKVNKNESLVTPEMEFFSFEYLTEDGKLHKSAVARIIIEMAEIFSKVKKCYFRTTILFLSGPFGIYKRYIVGLFSLHRIPSKYTE